MAFTEERNRPPVVTLPSDIGILFSWFNELVFIEWLRLFHYKFTEIDIYDMFNHGENRKCFSRTWKYDWHNWNAQKVIKLAKKIMITMAAQSLKLHVSSSSHPLFHSLTRWIGHLCNDRFKRAIHRANLSIDCVTWLFDEARSMKKSSNQANEW